MINNSYPIGDERRYANNLDSVNADMPFNLSAAISLFQHQAARMDIPEEARHENALVANWLFCLNNLRNSCKSMED